MFLSSALSILIRMYLLLWLINWRKQGIRDLFSSIMKRKGRDTVAIIHEDSKWTYGDLDEYSNRIANFLVSRGIKPSTNIALFMENEPKYIGIWFGAAKVCLFTSSICMNLYCFTNICNL